MKITESSIQKVVDFFEIVFREYKKEVDKWYYKYRFNFDSYAGNHIYIFDTFHLVIKKSYNLSDKPKIVKKSSSFITVDTSNSLVFTYKKLNEIIQKSPCEYAVKLVHEEYQFNGHMMSEDYEKYIEKEYEQFMLFDLKDKMNLAKGHKNYLDSISKVIEETCKTQYGEIDSLEDIYMFFFNLKLSKKLNNLWLVCGIYVPSMTQVFLDILCTGNYEITSLPLRQIFESYLRALDYDVDGKNSDHITNWIKTGKSGKPFGYSKKSDYVVKNVTKKLIFQKFSRNLKKEISDMWSDLSFDVHKHKIDIKFEYKYDKGKFDMAYKKFLKMVELLLITLVLNYPETYNEIKSKLGINREDLEIFLLENS